MSDTRLDVYLLGEPQPGAARSTLVRNLSTTFKKDVPFIEKMLRQSHSLLKANIDAATAGKYEAAIQKAGGQCELVAHGHQPLRTPASHIEQARDLTVAPFAPNPLSEYADEYDADEYDSEPPVTRSAREAALAVAGFFTFLIVLAGIGTIALPAYVDYTARSDLQAALPLINETRQAVAKVIKQKNFFPHQNILAGLQENISNEYIASITLGEGAAIVVTFDIPRLNDGRNTIIWTPIQQGQEIVWNCAAGTVPDEYRMPECRSSDRSLASPAPATPTSGRQANL